MNALERYQTKSQARMKAPWRPPLVSEFKQGHSVLSFDQSLSKTGWVYLRVSAGSVEVMGRGTMRNQSDLKGWRGNFEQARKIRAAMVELDGLLVRYSPDQMPRWPDSVLLEMPAVGGHRTDSSMLAAYEIDSYATDWWRATDMISIQQSRTILGGSDTRNDKKAGPKALVRYIPESAERTWNEHQRDAAVNALGHLYNLKQQEAADE